MAAPIEYVRYTIASGRSGGHSIYIYIYVIPLYTIQWPIHQRVRFHFAPIVALYAVSIPTSSSSCTQRTS